jgi:hypothetical protein
VDTLAIDIPACLAVFIDPLTSKGPVDSAQLPLVFDPNIATPTFELPARACFLLSSLYDDIVTHGEPPTTHMLEALISHLTRASDIVRASSFFGDVMRGIQDGSGNRQFARMGYTTPSEVVLFCNTGTCVSTPTMELESPTQDSDEASIGSSEAAGSSHSKDVIPLLGMYIFKMNVPAASK